MMQVRRRWDERLWPNPTKGFVPFKAHAMASLGAGGLTWVATATLV